MFRLKCKYFNLKDRRPKNAVFVRLSPLVAAHAPGGTCLEKKLFLHISEIKAAAHFFHGILLEPNQATFFRTVLYSLGAYVLYVDCF